MPSGCLDWKIQNTLANRVLALKFFSRSARVILLRCLTHHIQSTLERLSDRVGMIGLVSDFGWLFTQCGYGPGNRGDAGSVEVVGCGPTGMIGIG